MKDKRFIIKISILIPIILFLIISVYFNASYIVSMDTFAYSFVHHLRSVFTNNIFLILTLFAQTLTIVTIIYALWFLPNRKRVALPLTLCMIFSTAINALIKYIVNRARPVGEFVGNLFFNYGFPTSNSFPSGHSQAGLVFYYVLITILINECGLENKKAIIAWKTSAIIFALLIGLSRIIIGVHFFSDVLTGLLIGWLVILIFKKFYKKFYIINSCKNK